MEWFLIGLVIGGSIGAVIMGIIAGGRIREQVEINCRLVRRIQEKKAAESLSGGGDE